MDWKNKILDLLSAGLTQSEIAANVGVSQSTISELIAENQRDMRWVNGHRLLSLHKRVTKRRVATPKANEEAHHV